MHCVTFPGGKAITAVSLEELDLLLVLLDRTAHKDDDALLQVLVLPVLQAELAASHGGWRGPGCTWPGGVCAHLRDLDPRRGPRHERGETGRLPPRLVPLQSVCLEEI